MGYDSNPITGVTVCARNPGSWANGIKVAIVDSKADQIISVTNTSVTVGMGLTQSMENRAKL